MSETILRTKLYVPQPPASVVHRPHLTARLNEGLDRKLTLISAPAGSGKTTLVSEWLASCERPVAWLSLEEADSDPARFYSYIVAALQTINPDLGIGILNLLRSPQPPSAEAILTPLLNELAAMPKRFMLVLDDYHALDSRGIDVALAFLIEHMPPTMHLVLTTREDPQLPLSRLRARGQMSEIRATELRFSSSEAAEFLNQVMGLNLSAKDISALEARTEGWIAGLQLAAISMQGHEDTSAFIKSFTGSHRFVLDYLVEEVLHRLPENLQDFLLRTSILERLCGPLCDAVLPNPTSSGQQTLEYLEHANLFIVPLDNERRWYRYHHLFAELLRQRLHQVVTSPGGADLNIAELHIRASEWFEHEGLKLEAFQHAAAANDVDRAERLIEGRGVPLYVQGATVQVMNWLESLPASVLENKPSLQVMFAAVLSVAGQVTRVEEKLRLAESALLETDADENKRNLVGRIADLRALLALLSVDPDQFDTVIAQARRALEFLNPDALSRRASTVWKLGLAYQYKEQRAAATEAHTQAVAISEASGNTHVNILATTCLGKIQESNNQLNLAAESYRRAIQLIGDPPGPVGCEAYTGLARLFHEWNDLAAAKQHGDKGAELARQLQISSFITSELFLARLHIANGDINSAFNLLTRTEDDARKRNFLSRIPEITSVQALAHIRQGDLETATQLAQSHNLPLIQARIHLAEGNPTSALKILEPFGNEMATNSWHDMWLRALLLQAIAHHMSETESALHLVDEILGRTETEGFVRSYLDEGKPMQRLLVDARARGIKPDYTARLLAGFSNEELTPDNGQRPSPAHGTQPLIEPLSRREIEVLQLVALGLSNREISERLFISLDTVKGHNRVIFGKLQVQRRTEAVARARELGLL
jgi:LuxR family transcriptional regulator, maltose regulon positive regulatory protein